MEFSKPALSLEQQLQLLLDRGLIVNGIERANRYLEHIGYYRLSAYMIPHYENKATHHFKKNTRFDDILNVYIFDHKLRLLLLEAIERIEVSFRSQVSNSFANKLSAHAYLEPIHFDTRYKHDWLIKKIEDEMQKSKEVFIAHYKEKYNMPQLPPVWMAIHLLSFKELVLMYQHIKNNLVKKSIAYSYGLKEPVLTSWMRTLSDLRNLCAHHSRVWNRSFGSKAVLPKTTPARWLSAFPELIDIGNNHKISPHNSLFFHVVIIWYFISQMNQDSSWVARLVTLCDEYKIDMTHLGFPQKWRQDNYWRVK
ncbi:Abi family protein [Facilibium subflavum]|uniref:Abi family protein n=1 Tax=Facilibium subflavum TaxID=2219058 RepID=UPI000E64B588|nr:Abi family protein [Facilibium subflavum]